MNKQFIKRLLICRTCLCSIEDCDQSISINNYAKTLNYENILIIDMIEKCTPELDLDISDDTVICKSCYDLLINSYEFKSICFQTEERIYSFVEANGLKLGDKMDLRDLVEDSIFIEHSKFEDLELLPSRAVAISNRGDTSFMGANATKSEAETTANDSTGGSEEGSGRVWKRSEIKQKQYLKREYSCDKCEYKGYRRDLLKKHLKFKCKNRIKSTKFKCDVCPYTTIRRRHLTRHKLTHGGTRPYICGNCNKGFTEKTNLRYHIIYKHSGDQLPFKCGEGDCKAAFARKCDLNAHILKHLN